jgi:hypothetical protein
LRGEQYSSCNACDGLAQLVRWHMHVAETGDAHMERHHNSPSVDCCAPQHELVYTVQLPHTVAKCRE